MEELKSAVSGLGSTTAIVTVSGVSGVLAWGNTWVQTKFVATVTEVLAVGKSVLAPDRFNHDQPIEFFVEGGEAAVDGVIVRAGDVTKYPIGRRYLVFLNQKGRENGWGVDSTPLLIEGDRLSAVAPSASRLSGLTLTDVRKAIGETK